MPSTEKSLAHVPPSQGRVPHHRKRIPHRDRQQPPRRSLPSSFERRRSQHQQQHLNLFQQPPEPQRFLITSAKRQQRWSDQYPERRTTDQRDERDRERERRTCVHPTAAEPPARSGASGRSAGRRDGSGRALGWDPGKEAASATAAAAAPTATAAAGRLSSSSPLVLGLLFLPPPSPSYTHTLLPAIPSLHFPFLILCPQPSSLTLLCSYPPLCGHPTPPLLSFPFSFHTDDPSLCLPSPFCSIYVFDDLQFNLPLLSSSSSSSPALLRLPFLIRFLLSWVCSRCLRLPFYTSCSLLCFPIGQQQCEVDKRILSRHEGTNAKVSRDGTKGSV
jgi:hypothetical protein